MTSLNKSTLTEDQEFSCIGNIQVWLITHVIVLFCVHMYLCACVFSPIYFFVQLFTTERDDYSEDEHQENYLKLIRLLKREVVLIFVYVNAAFLYVWIDFMNINYTITNAVIIRWLIEATLAPYILFVIIFVGSGEGIEPYMDRSQSYIFEIVIKVPLFIMMRYAESKPHFFLHDFESFLFYIVCCVSVENTVSVRNIFHVTGNHSFVRQ
jgi:hypothetical protein